MHWKEQLKAKIESLKDEDYRHTSIMFGRLVENHATIHMDCEPATLLEIAKRTALNRCNDHEFCGVKRGLLLLTGFEWNGQGHLDFCLRKTTPWNIVHSREPGQFEEMNIYEYFDFDFLP